MEIRLLGFTTNRKMRTVLKTTIQRIAIRIVRVHSLDTLASIHEGTPASKFPSGGDQGS